MHAKMRFYVFMHTKCPSTCSVAPELLGTCHNLRDKQDTRFIKEYMECVLTSQVTFSHLAILCMRALVLSADPAPFEELPRQAKAQKHARDARTLTRTQMRVKAHFYRSEGLPERDISSLCVMGWGLEVSGNSSVLAVAVVAPLPSVCVCVCVFWMCLFFSKNP